jgi:hypothetical protein
MTRAVTIVFAPIRLVPGRIPGQPGATSHRSATDCITGRTVSGRRERDTGMMSVSQTYFPIHGEHVAARRSH